MAPYWVRSLRTPSTIFIFAISLLGQDPCNCGVCGVPGVLNGRGVRGSKGCTGEHGGIWESEKAVEGNREGSEGCGGSVGREGINRAKERQGEEGAFN